MLAHAGTPDEQVALLLLTAGLWTAWAALSRIRKRGFPRMPLVAAWGLGGLAIAMLVGAVVLPPYLRTLAAKRPSTTATLAFVSPTPDQRIDGNTLTVQVRLTGGTIIPAGTTKLQPNAGHIHISIDGRVVSMAYGTEQQVDISGFAPGPHALTAEFVAADHGPFSPQVIATTSFVRVAHP